MNDVGFMHRALELARKGAGWVNPNPQVGCVIVRDGRITGQGWHARFGDVHAERAALASCTEDPRGATLYVTLEPCCHTGHQPPCVEAILDSGIARVVVGSSDPNPLVAGGGVRRLRSAGVHVDEGVARAECDRLNEAFFHYITTREPFVLMKYAMTMDGKVATRTGASRWVTGEAARRRVHADRGRYAAVMVGVGTVLADDPLLTCRIEGCHEPVRIVVDARLRTPLTSQLVCSAALVGPLPLEAAVGGSDGAVEVGKRDGAAHGRAGGAALAGVAPAVPGPVVIATACTDAARQGPYRAAGVRILEVPGTDGEVDLRALMRELGALGVDSVILEGGPTLGAAALEAGIVRRVQAYVAPKLFGGSGAPSPVMGAGVAEPSEAVRLGSPTVRRFGEDLLLEADVPPAVAASGGDAGRNARRGRAERRVSAACTDVPDGPLDNSTGASDGRSTRGGATCARVSSERASQHMGLAGTGGER